MDEQWPQAGDKVLVCSQYGVRAQTTVERLTARDIVLAEGGGRFRRRDLTEYGQFTAFHVPPWLVDPDSDAGRKALAQHELGMARTRARVKVREWVEGRESARAVSVAFDRVARLEVARDGSHA